MSVLSAMASASHSLFLLGDALAVPFVEPSCATWTWKTSVASLTVCMCCYVRFGTVALLLCGYHFHGEIGPPFEKKAWNWKGLCVHNFSTAFGIALLVACVEPCLRGLCLWCVHGCAFGRRGVWQPLGRLLTDCAQQ